MPEPVTLAISAISTFIGFRQRRSAEKKARQSAALAAKARDVDDKIEAVKARAARADRIRKVRAAVARNIAASFQGESGGGGSTLAAANSGIITTNAVNLGNQTKVQNLGQERRGLLQSSSDLAGESQVASSNAGFLFSIAQQTAPSKEEFQDLFSA